jgi:glycosyltransferase involved in cell wall biosynthesis
LVEALGLLSLQDRSKLRVVVAGEPLMPMAPILARHAELSLQEVIDFRLKRLSEDEMATLFADTDVFVFPYLQIEASGVFYMVMRYGCWIIASDLGAFKDAITDGRNGVRLAPGEPRPLADAILASIGKRPDPSLELTATSWEEIGVRTRSVYYDAIASTAARS